MDDKVDKYDYLLGAFIGIFAGIMDVLFVGKPGDSMLGNWTDKKTNDIVMKYAQWKGYTPKNGEPNLQNAVQFLEKAYPVNYDHGKSIDTGNVISHMTPKNHHLKSLGHSPDLIGLGASILDQFQNKSTFIDNGKIIRINSEYELEGSNFVSKVYAGAGNWFGHLMSDVAGSNGAIGKGNRGSGIPIPFYNMFGLCNFGEFGQYRQPLSTIMVQVFEHGYDLRHGFAMAIPVLVGNVTTMLAWSLKRRFYHQWGWRECMPSDNYKSYRRMQLTQTTALCLVDGVDAYIRGKGNPVTVILHMNLIAWLQLVKLIIKEIMKTYGRSYADINKDLEMINTELDKELACLQAIDYQAWKLENEKMADLNRRMELADTATVGQLAFEYCFTSQVKVNYKDLNEFKALVKGKKALW